MRVDAAKRVLVTGGSSGIGRAIAVRLSQCGFEVWATSRCCIGSTTLDSSDQPHGVTGELSFDHEQSAHDNDAVHRRLTNLEEQVSESCGKVRFLPLDLGETESIRALSQVIETEGGIDVLINNAGYGVFGAVESVGADDVRHQFQVNCCGPIELTRLLLPGLRQRQGHIIWVGSLMNYVPLPFQAHYSATKAAIAAFSDALRMEVAPYGLKVSCVEPGDFASNFTDKRQLRPQDGAAYARQYRECLDIVEQRERTAPEPTSVANLVLRLLTASNPPVRRPVGEWARTVRVASRLLPDRFRLWVLARMFRSNRATPQSESGHDDVPG